MEEKDILDLHRDMDRAVSQLKYLPDDDWCGVKKVKDAWYAYSQELVRIQDQLKTAKERKDN